MRAIFCQCIGNKNNPVHEWPGAAALFTSGAATGAMEIKELATGMLKIIKQVCPVVFEKAGPIVCGSCPEGKFTCDNPKAGDFDA